MNPLFDNAIDFVADTVHRFYACEDVEQVISRFAPDFSWVGAGEVEFSTDSESIFSYLLERAPLAPPCEVFGEEFYLVNVTEQTCTVMGRYHVRTAADSGLVLEERQRCSYELVDMDGELKIRHVHASNPYQVMKDEAYFPFEGGQQNYDYLQQMVREKTETINLITSNINGGLKMSEDDESYSFAYVNEGLARLLGYTIDEFMEMSGGTAVGAVYPPDLAGALEDVARCFAEGPTYETEYRIRRKDGSLAWMLDSGCKVQAADGSVKINSVLMDITARKMAEQELELERERYRIALRSVTDVLFEYDFEHDVLVEFERKQGSEDGGLEKRRFSNYAATVDRGTRIHPDDYQRLAKALQGGESATMDVRRRLPDYPGQWRWTRMHATVLCGRDGKAVRTIGSWKDVTEERQHLDELVDQARRDPLTKLFNQGAAVDLVSQTLAQGGQDGKGALFVIDVDDFKRVNDTLGHLAGDDLLIRTAQAIEAALAPEEFLVARIGGDEFLAFLPSADQHCAADAAVRVNQAAKNLGGAQHPVSLSIGVAFAGVDGDTYEHLFAAADRALYRAKRQGKDSVCFAEKEG